MSYDIKNISFYNDDMVTRIYDNLSKVTDDTIIEFVVLISRLLIEGIEFSGAISRNEGKIAYKVKVAFQGITGSPSPHIDPIQDIDKLNNVRFDLLRMYKECTPTVGDEVLTFFDRLSSEIAKTDNKINAQMDRSMEKIAIFYNGDGDPKYNEISLT